MKYYISRGVGHFAGAFRRAFKFWLPILIVSLALAYLCGLFAFTNPYRYYVPEKLVQAILLVPFIFMGLAYLVGIFRLPQGVAFSKMGWLRLVAWSAAIAVFLFFLLPNPRPLIPQNHQLKLIASGEKNRFASDSVIEVRQIKSLDGRVIPLNQFQTSGGWDYTSDELLAPHGSPGSIAEFSGMVPGGIAIHLRYLPEAGKVTIRWDQIETVIDLYTPSAPTIEEFILDGFEWSQLTLLQSGLIILTYIAYFMGLFAIALGANLVIAGHFVHTRAAKILLIFSYILLFIWFLGAKFSYTEFTGNRPFKDSRSYVQAADIPLTSIAFWAGERPFTFPLLLKIFDVHFADNWPSIKMERVEMFQILLSITSWGLLAFLVSYKVQQNWLKPLAFGCILGFSLSLEIGIWDSLMLSESLSNSLFALLIAIWMGWEVLSGKNLPAGVRWLYFVCWALVAVLYSFVRDSNQYFLLIAAGIFLARMVLKHKLDSQKRVGLFFTTFILLIVVLQSISISAGNRWQIFLYDHLGTRLLKDASATAFFADHGLPISEPLMKTVDMDAAQYQMALASAPELEAVRQWVNQSGKTTYLLYLLSQLGDSLMEPIRQIPSLVDGTTLAYEYPTYHSRPASKEIQDLSNFYYFRGSTFEVLAAIGLFLAVILWLVKGHSNSAWFIVVLLAISIYPMMFIIWHGEPLEIERHALQIGIQYRLAAWMALIFFIDHVTIRVFSTSILPKRRTSAIIGSLKGA